MILWHSRNAAREKVWHMHHDQTVIVIISITSFLRSNMTWIHFLSRKMRLIPFWGESHELDQQHDHLSWLHRLNQTDHLPLQSWMSVILWQEFLLQLQVSLIHSLHLQLVFSLNMLLASCCKQPCGQQLVASSASGMACLQCILDCYFKPKSKTAQTQHQMICDRPF